MKAIDRISQIENFLLAALGLSFCVSLTATWSILTLLLVIALAAPDRLKRLQSLNGAPLLWPLASFCLMIICAGFANGGAAEAIKSFATARGLLIYFIAFQCLHKYGQSAFLPVLLVCGAVSGVWGVIQQVFNFHPFTYPYLQATGFLGDPMSFAGLMQLTSFLSLGLLVKNWSNGQSFFNRQTLLFVTAANFLGLIFASERSAWLGMFLALPLIFLYISPRAFVRGSLALVLAAVLAWCFIPVVKTRLSTLANFEQDVSVKARVIIWSKAWQIFREHPLFGVGPRNFPSIDMPEAIVPQHSKDLNHAHNNYLQILSTTGFMGFSSFFVLLVSALCFALKQSKVAEPLKSGIGLGLLGALLSLSVAGLFEYNFGSGQVKLVQWFLLALLDSGSKLQLEPGARLVAPADEQSLNND